ncbi:MAG TPA: response regulator [Polyangiales bacterium]|nr:response regulator [Polyangiales bacterium]
MSVNILVADDSVTMRRILEVTFQGEDAQVTSVDSGEAAVRKAAELTPDVVFADLSLSGMDGYSVASAIKAAPGLEKTAVVVMASQKHPYDEDKGKAAGVDDHILKPFDTQLVIDRVKQVLAKPRVMPTAGKAAAAAPAASPVGSPQAANQQGRVGAKTITAIGKPMAAPPPPAPKPQPTAAVATARAAPAMSAAVATSPAAVAITAAEAELPQRLGNLGLSPDQVTAVLALSREVIERVVWEVVPELAETLIKEEIRRLTST